MKNENIVKYFISVFCFLLILLHLPNLTHLLGKFGYVQGHYMVVLCDKEKFHKEHFPYFALNWHKFEYENISKYKYIIDNPEPEFQRTPESRPFHKFENIS